MRISATLSTKLISMIISKCIPERIVIFFQRRYPVAAGATPLAIMIFFIIVSTELTHEGCETSAGWAQHGDIQLAAGSLHTGRRCFPLAIPSICAQTLALSLRPLISFKEKTFNSFLVIKTNGDPLLVIARQSARK
jgi:hypothetical protein